MKADKGKKFASGGMSRPAALERRRQQEYLERNPQYREREKGLKGVYPEEFMTPGGAAKAGSGVMAAAKDGISNLEKAVLIGAVGKGAAITAFDKEQQRKKAERERAEKAKKEAERKRAEEDKSDKSSYRKGGSVKSSASRRADGIAQRGKTRGKFI